MAANSNNFEANARFNNLSSSSSLDYASFLFLDDSLFSNSCDIKADDYKSSDFPGSDLVNPDLVFARPGYNAPRLPFIKNSKFCLSVGFFSFCFSFLSIFSYLVSFDNFSGFHLFIFISSIFSSLGLLVSFISLPKAHSRFFQGRNYIHAGIIFSVFSAFISLWLLVLYMTL